jgi:hypothetical protein
MFKPFGLFLLVWRISFVACSTFLTAICFLRKVAELADAFQEYVSCVTAFEVNEGVARSVDEVVGGNVFPRLLSRHSTFQFQLVY